MKIINIEKYIDHTNLKPEAKPADIVKLCQEANEYGFAAVCVNPCYVKLAKQILNGYGTVCAVIGFPLGANTTETKVFESKNAIENGATEIDMVINIGRLKAGDIDYVTKDINAVVAASAGAACVKVIIECCLLEENEKINACLAALNGGADFVKTSTGFSTGGATVEDVKLMRKTVGTSMKIKAAGGIRDYATSLKMIEAGANRIGASAGIAIVDASKANE